MVKKNKFRENYVFLGLVCLFFAIGALSLIKTPSRVSVSENRSLNQFQHFTIKDFLNGSFQSNFEQALSDQFIKSGKIRTLYGDAISSLPDYGISNLICKNRYIDLGGSKFDNATFNCDDFIVWKPIIMNTPRRNILSKNIKAMDFVSNTIDTYIYYIDESQVFNFEEGSKVVNFDEVIRKNISGNFSFFGRLYDSYDQLKEVFYKTDHHWNYIGSYRGYCDISDMLGFEPARPSGTITQYEDFFGSKARDARSYDFKDEFIIYKFNLPDHDTFVNHKLGAYGHYEDFEKHNYIYNRTSFYAWVYGNDYGEVKFDFHQPDKENLLIFSNSFDNPINVLIAQHYNNTYAVDLRHYKEQLGEDFDLKKYITENQIDKVLFIINPLFLLNNASTSGLES